MYGKHFTVGEHHTGVHNASKFEPNRSRCMENTLRPQKITQEYISNACKFEPNRRERIDSPPHVTRMPGRTLGGGSAACSPIAGCIQAYLQCIGSCLALFCARVRTLGIKSYETPHVLRTTRLKGHVCCVLRCLQVEQRQAIQKAPRQAGAARKPSLASAAPSKPSQPPLQGPSRDLLELLGKNP